MEYPSRLVQQAVEQMSRLPGIGQRTALRMVLHLVREKQEKTVALTDALSRLRERILFCERCHNISDDTVCRICRSPRRNDRLLCVVEDTRDVLAIENTAQYTGLYHVLGGVISPMNGIGPSELHIDSLLSRIEGPNSNVEEVILALSPTIEGDTTAFYIGKRLRSLSVKLTAIARGVPIGGNLEFADEITLGRSILTRTAMP